MHEEQHSTVSAVSHYYRLTRHMPGWNSIYSI